MTKKPRKKRKILTVERSHLILDIIKRELLAKDPTYEVHPCTTGREAMHILDKMREQDELPSLVILSTELNDTTGYKLCRMIKEDVRTGQIPILMVSSKSREVEIDKAFEAGVNDYIIKGPDIKILPDKVRRIFAEIRRKSRELILIVEDNVLVQKLIIFALEQKGYKVATALNGESGLEKAKLLEPSLIILDLIMPVMDGFELARRLRDDPELSHIPTLALTVVDDIRDHRRLYHLGVKQVISKPFDNVKLALEVEELIDAYGTRPVLDPDEDDGEAATGPQTVPA